MTAIIFTINSSRLFHWDFVNAPLVATTLIRRGQEGLNHADGFLVGDKTARHGDDIGIVMLTGEAGYRQAPAQG